MVKTPIKIQLVKTLADVEPSRIVAVKNDGDTTFSLYITDKQGVPFPIKDNSGIVAITNTDGNLDINGTEINISPTLLATISSALQSGDNISELTNDVGYITVSDLPTIVNDKNYIHNQVVASDTWQIQHNLGKFPSVSIVDSGDNLVVGEVKYIDSNNVLITFTSVFSGKAYLN